MPAYEIPVNLTIGFFPPPVVKVDPGPSKPRLGLWHFMMNGELSVYFSFSVGFPKIPEESITMEIKPGYLTDPDKIGFSYKITDYSSDHIDFKLVFDHPLALSQYQATPEMMNVTIYMGNFTEYEGSRNFTGYLSMEDFVPR